MRYVIEQVRRKENHQMLSVIRMEIDYELVTLFDAMKANDQEKIKRTKEKLTRLVNQLKNLSLNNI